MSKAGKKAPATPEWAVEEYLGRCTRDVQRYINNWPVKHRATLAALLRKLADEAEQMPAITCCNCGYHEVDADGDCSFCHEPGIAPAPLERQAGDKAEPGGDANV